MYSNKAYLFFKDAKMKGKEGKVVQVRAWSSQKQEDGTYENDFNGFVTLVGKAKEKLGTITEGSFQILSCGVKTHYDKEKQKDYINYIVFDIDDVKAKGAKKEAPANSADEFPEADVDDLELPF